MRTEKSVLFGAIMLTAAIAFVPVSFAELNPTTQPDPGLPTSSVDGPNAPVVQPPTQPTNVLQRAQAMQEVTQLIQEDIAQNGQPSDFIAMAKRIHARMSPTTAATLEAGFPDSLGSLAQAAVQSNGYTVLSSQTYTSSNTGNVPARRGSYLCRGNDCTWIPGWMFWLIVILCVIAG